MLQTKLVEKIKTHFVFSNFFFFENRTVYEIMWKNFCRAGQAANDNMAHAHCMLDTKGYRHTLRICNNYCLSTTRMVARTRIDVKLHVHCLCYYYLLICQQMFIISDFSPLQFTERKPVGLVFYINS